MIRAMVRMRSTTSMKWICLLCIFYILTAHCQMSKTEKQIDQPDQELIIPEYVDKEFVMGQFDPELHQMFVEIDKAYTNRDKIVMHREAYHYFEKMWEAAKNDGVDLIIRSATRNFDYQKGIWEGKWTGDRTLSDGSKANAIADPVERAKKILLYSSMPGTSRHHWGTDIDLNAFENEYFESGEGLKVYNWLLNNASDFGFCQTYTSKSGGRTGYEEEKWHWTYLPLSKLFTHFYKRQITNSDISGFAGGETAQEIDMVHNYVLGIDVSCL